VHTAAPDPVFSLTLKRNCSISPSGLSWLLGLMMATSLGIASAFAVAGAWMVLPFAGVEMLALAAAFYLHGRHAADYERLAISNGRVCIEVRDGEKTMRRELDCAWARVCERSTGLDLRVSIVAHGAEVEVGRHLDGERRRQLAMTLRAALHDRIDGLARSAPGWNTNAKGQEKR
jgi:uncharacterized membrane protein